VAGGEWRGTKTGIYKGGLTVISTSGKLKLPKNGPAPERPKVGHNPARKQKPEFGELGLVDREWALELLYRVKSSLRGIVASCEGLSEATAEIETTLYFSHKPGSAFAYNMPGVGMITAVQEGLHVKISDRSGVIAWEDVANYWIDEIEAADFAETRYRPDDDDTPLDSNGRAGETNESPAETKPASNETKKASRKGAKAQSENGAAPASLTTHHSPLITLSSVEPNPFQPRHEFGADELKSLGASIRSDGLLHPLLLRPKPGAADKFEIVDGERRWRAAKAVGLHTLPAIVRETSDEQMATLAMKANLERSDLSAIEEAAQFKLLVDRFGYNQERIAKTFGQTAGQISNRLRLLELPAEWQKRIISQEIGPTHARALVPYAKHKPILEAMATELKREPAMSVPSWEKALQRAVLNASRPLSGWFNKKFTDGKTHSGEVAFKPSDAERAELEVIEIKTWRGKEKVALNVRVWERLQLAGEQRKAERQEKAAAKGAKAGKGKLTTPKGGKPPKKKSAAEIAAQFQKRLYAWKANWLRWECSEALREALEVGTQGDLYAAMKVVLWASANQRIDFDGPYASTMAQQNEFGRRDEILDKAVAASTNPRRKDIGDCECGESVEIAAMRFVRGLLWQDKEGPQRYLPADVVEWLAADLAVALAVTWKQTLAGPLTQEYFELHSKEQLGTLAKELKVTVDLARPKGEIVKVLMDAPATKKRLPAEIANAKGGKRG